MNNTLYASGHGKFADCNPLANVTVLGVMDKVNEVKLNGNAIEGGWVYNATTKALHVTKLEEATKAGAYAQDWSLSWL